MKKCVNCGQEISDGAIFCGYCRTKQPSSEMEDISARGTICPFCQNVNSATAKFCNHCGKPLSVSEENPSEYDLGDQTSDHENIVDKQRGYITWSVLPGQLAVKIDEKEIDGYGLIRGLYVAPGTKALFFVNGKYAATLDSGRYSFNEMRQEANPTQRKGMLGFLTNVAGYIANGVSALLRLPGRPFYSIILCRGNEFPLVYEFENLRTASVSCNIGLHFLCKISNINSFAESLLTDNKFVSLQTVADRLNPYIQTIVNQKLREVTPERIEEDPAWAEQLLDLVRERVQGVYPYLNIVQIIRATAINEELDKIRRLKEELYVKEQELEQVQLRNDFLNRLQDANRRNELQNARSETDFRALMDGIELDGLRNENTKKQAILMLMAESALQRARTQSELDIAMNQLVQSNMLSDEEINVLREQIDHRAAMVRIGHGQEIAMANLENGQLLALATIRNEVAIEHEKLKWELEIGNKRFENALWRQREQNKLKNEERESDYAFEKQQMQDQMSLLAQAQELRSAREEAEHRRKMEEIRAQNEIERAKLDNALEKTKVMATMTFEQIMALNPDISPDAAKALAEKFKAEAAATNIDQYNALVERYIADMKTVGQQNIGIIHELIQSQNQLSAARLNDKQAEMDRVYQTTERNTDRVLESVKTTVGAVSSQPHVIVPPSPMVATTPVVPVSPAVMCCPNCGKKNVKKNSFCEECGTDLS